MYLKNTKFYSDTGFDVIKNWLKKNCNSILNENYFENLSPLTNIQKINESQNLTDELLASFDRNKPLPLTFIPNIKPCIELLKIENSQLNPNDFQQLYKIIVLSRKIKTKLTKVDFPIWYTCKHNLQSLKSYEKKIEHIFNNNFKIKKDASSVFSMLHSSYNELNDKISKSMNNIFNHAKNKNWLEGDQVVLKNGRSVLPLKTNHKRKIKGIIQDQSSTGKTSFIEPYEIIELNNQLTEINFKIELEKIKILKNLTLMFNKISNKIQTLYNFLQLLDQHFTIAKFANITNSIKPIVNNTGVINLVEAINPLFILTDNKAIPLNLTMISEKVLLLSGPNAGGKTIVLKSLGLFSLMAQCGIFIPGKKINLPIYKNYMSDIGDGQSIENGLSTFSAHIKNLAYILKNANESSLILIDELGSGTEPEAGSALSQSILLALMKKNSTVITTTHISLLKNWAYKTKGVINGGMVFDLKTFSPTYELILGTPSASYTLEISERMGLNKNIIKQSKSLISNEKTNLENILSKLEKDRLKSKKIVDVLILKKEKLLKKEHEIINKEKKIEDIFKEAKKNALNEAELIILSARKEAENLISEIKNSNDIIKDKKNQLNKTLNKIKSQKKNIVENNTFKFDEAIAGTIVYIPKLKNIGKILHTPKKQNKILIESNGIKLILKLSDLEPNKSNQTNFSHSKSSNSNFKTTKLNSINIDLRGKRVEEALIETEIFIDRAIMAGVSYVNILHGKGTGSLMDAIHNYLEKQTSIKNYKFANEDHGGAGITIVEFK